MTKHPLETVEGTTISDAAIDLLAKLMADEQELNHHGHVTGEYHDRRMADARVKIRAVLDGTYQFPRTHRERIEDMERLKGKTDDK